MSNLKFRFNTNRPYQPKGHRYEGQVIDVIVEPDPLIEGNVLITFLDMSRGLDGKFTVWDAGNRQAEYERIVMRVYDNNQHQDPAWFDMTRRAAKKELAE